LDLFACLNKFVEREHLPAEEAVFCSHCRQHLAPVKKMDLWTGEGERVGREREQGEREQGESGGRGGGSGVPRRAAHGVIPTMPLPLSSHTYHSLNTIPSPSLSPPLRTHPWYGLGSAGGAGGASQALLRDPRAGAPSPTPPPLPCLALTLQRSSVTPGQWGFGSRDKITAHVDFPVDGLDLTGGNEGL